MATRVRSASKPTPEQLAERGVREFFKDLVTTGSVPDADFIDDTIGEVAEALTAEHEKEHGPIDDARDSGTRELISQRAGYLVGVQVGRRLAGGAR